MNFYCQTLSERDDIYNRKKRWERRKGKIEKKKQYNYLDEWIESKANCIDRFLGLTEIHRDDKLYGD